MEVVFLCLCERAGGDERKRANVIITRITPANVFVSHTGKNQPESSSGSTSCTKAGRVDVADRDGLNLKGLEVPKPPRCRGLDEPSGEQLRHQAYREVHCSSTRRASSYFKGLAFRVGV